MGNVTLENNIYRKNGRNSQYYIIASLFHRRRDCEEYRKETSAAVEQRHSQNNKYNFILSN